MNKKLIITICIVIAVILFLNWPYWEAQIQSPRTPKLDFPAIDQPTITVPSLGITVPLIFPRNNTETEIQLALQDGVAHFAGTALPGELGNVYVVGHSSDYVWVAGDYKNIFAKLPKLKIGADIFVKFKNQDFLYKAIETRVVSARDLSVLDQPADRKLLTLQTSYPIGTALKRYVVVAELVE